MDMESMDIMADKLGKKTQCKKCGQCCCDVQVRVSPMRLKEAYDAWMNRKPFKAMRDIHLLYPMLTFKYETRPISDDGKRRRLYHYHCKFYDPVRKCTIYDIRPWMCKGFPYYGKKPKDTKLRSQYKGCGYNKKKGE